MKEGDPVSFVRSVSDGEFNDNTEINNGRFNAFSIRGTFERWGESYLQIEDKKIPLTVAIVRNDDLLYLVPPDHLQLGHD